MKLEAVWLVFIERLVLVVPNISSILNAKDRRFSLKYTLAHFHSCSFSLSLSTLYGPKAVFYSDIKSVWKIVYKIFNQEHAKLPGDTELGCA